MSFDGKHMSDRNFIIISYYTQNTGYELEVQKLIASLERFDLPFFIKGIKSFGSWHANTQYKAEFIGECLKRFKKPVVFLDADAIVEQDPILFDDIDEDIAVHYRYITENCSKLLSGTIYMRPTKAAFDILQEWKRKNNMYIDNLEQVNLERVLATVSDGQTDITCRVFDLPSQYCNIFDLMNVDDPVITHYQASRRYK